MNTVIVGSYGKHFQQILELRDFLSEQGVKVLAPSSSKVINPGSNFLILEDDPIGEPKELQDLVFEKIKKSNFIIVANVDGYIGRTAAFEMGYALSLGLPIYTLEPVTDLNISGYCIPLENKFRGFTLS